MPWPKRTEDIPALVSHFIEKKSRELNIWEPPKLESGGMEYIENQDEKAGYCLWQESYRSYRKSGRRFFSVFTDRVVITLLLGLSALAILDPTQAFQSLRFSL